MGISGVSDISSFLTQQASSMSSSQVQQAIQVAVLKKTLDQQKVEGEAIVQMIQNTPGPKELGSRLDISI